MPRDTTESDRRLTRTQTAIVSLVAVVCILVAGAAVVTAQQQTFSDDFEDGDIQGWTSVHGQGDISTESIEGEYSLHAETEETGGDGETTVEWENGPNLDLQESFDITFTGRPSQSQNTRVRVGVIDDRNLEGENALLIFDEENGATYLGTYYGEQLPGSENRIENDYNDEWVNVRIQSEEGNTSLDATVWEYGTQEPSSPQLSQTFDGETSGTFGIDVGNLDGGYRQFWLDSVSLEGETVNDSQDLRLDIPGYLKHNASSSYAVEANESGTWTDVTGQASVTPENTDALTFYPDNQTVVAGGNKSINERVNVTATYDGLTAVDYTVVATPTVDNLDLLPAWWSVNAVMSDWTMVWILLSTLIATAASRMSTTFAGIGAFAMAMIMGWIMGDVPDGIMVATIFMALFIGLNLAANIDYSVR